MPVFYSRLQIPELPIPTIGAQVGVTMDVSPANKVDARWTVNGDPFIVQSPFPRRMVIDIRASGKAIQAEPGWAAIALGDNVTIYSLKTQTDWILAGQTSRVVDHQVVPGSVIIAHDLQGRVVAPTFAGNVVSIPAPLAFNLCFRFRPVYLAKLVGHSGSASEVDGSATWSGKFVERVH